MLHFLRQNKQGFGALATTLLLMVWLSLTCQNCFANSNFADSNEEASLLHAAMDCCSEEGYSDHNRTEFDHKSCEPNYLTNQPVAVEKIVMQSGNQVFELLPVSLGDSSVPSPDRYQQAGLSQDSYFSPRLFSSYRILLI